MLKRIKLEESFKVEKKFLGGNEENEFMLEKIVEKFKLNKNILNTLYETLLLDINNLEFKKDQTKKIIKLLSEFDKDDILPILFLLCTKNKNLKDFNHMHSFNEETNYEILKYFYSNKGYKELEELYLYYVIFLDKDELNDFSYDDIKDIEIKRYLSFHKMLERYEND